VALLAASIPVIAVLFIVGIFLIAKGVQALQ
jgi:hypothetical protein